MQAKSARDRRAALVEGGREARAVLATVEAALPPRDCAMRTGCCRFRATGLVPQLTLGEAAAAALALRAAGRTHLPESVDGDCPLLDARGMCRIYPSRPLGCRTYFCAAAGGQVERAYVRDAVRRLDAIDESLAGCGPRALPVAVADALAVLER